MSFLKPQEFADHFGIKYSTVRGHISRKKLIKTGKHIDTDHPVNKIYIQENCSTETPVVEKPAKKTQPLKPTRNEDIETAPPPIPSGADISEKEYTDWVTRKKKADAEKSELQAVKLRLENAKLQGKLMPIELVEKTFTINLHSIFRSFESSSENIASIYNERLGGDRADLADMIRRMRQELERAIANAKQKSKEEIKALMQEYAATRSRGEKK